MIVKICNKHGELTEDKVCKEKNNSLKLGYQLRCIECRRDKDRKYKLNNPDKHRASASTARNEARRLYREGLSNKKPKADIWAAKDRKLNPEKYKKWAKTSRDNLGQLRNTREVCRRFDTTVDKYHEMLSNQNNKCAICRKEETRRSRTEGKICALAIDHNHETGKIRELLCHNCNQVVGHSRESIEILEQTILYLEKHQHIEEK